MQLWLVQGHMNPTHDFLSAGQGNSTAPGPAHFTGLFPGPVSPLLFPSCTLL